MPAQNQTAPEGAPELRQGQIYLSVKEVAARFGVSVPSVWRWAKAPDIDFPKPIHIVNMTKWRLSDIEAFEAHCAENPRTRKPYARGRYGRANNDNA